MDIQTASTASTRVAVAAATGISVWGMTFGDMGVGIVGVSTLVVSALLKLYVEFREEQRRQLAQDLEVSNDSWKVRYEHAVEETATVKNLLEVQREEIEILRKRVQDMADTAHPEPPRNPDKVS